jgi:peptide/nickel transport system permease protein
MENDQKNRELKNIPDAPQNIALDDERRVKVLSPSMLVFKRFIRNRLAITGAIFIIFMFIFSFVGGWVMPYDEGERFYKHTDMSKDYAGISENKDYRFTTMDGSEFPLAARSQFVLAVNSKKTEMSSNNIDYTIEKLGEDLYYVDRLTEVAIATMIAKQYDIAVSDKVSDPGFEDAFRQALKDSQTSFESGGVTYTITGQTKSLKACVAEPYAVVSMNIFDYASADSDAGYEFVYRAELAFNDLKNSGKDEGSTQFRVAGARYTMEMKNGEASIYDSSGALYANISRYIVQAIYPDVFLTVDYKTIAKNAVNANQTEFTYTDESGVERQFSIERKNLSWTVRWIEDTKVTDTYASPTWAHPLGTDGNGMDVLTRLMYGDRFAD